MSQTFRFTFGRTPSLKSSPEEGGSSSNVNLDWLLGLNKNLRDGADDCQRFRDILTNENIQTSELIRWLNQAREADDELHQRAFQDIVNALAKKLGFQVEFGCYEKSGAAPFQFDGLWHGKAMHLGVNYFHGLPETYDFDYLKRAIDAYFKTYSVPPEQFGCLFVFSKGCSKKLESLVANSLLQNRMRFLGMDAMLEVISMYENSLITPDELDRILRPARLLYVTEVMAYVNGFFSPGSAPPVSQGAFEAEDYVLPTPAEPTPSAAPAPPDPPPEPVFVAEPEPEVINEGSLSLPIHEPVPAVEVMEPPSKQSFADEPMAAPSRHDFDDDAIVALTDDSIVPQPAEAAIEVNTFIPSSVPAVATPVPEATPVVEAAPAGGGQPSFGLDAIRNRLNALSQADDDIVVLDESEVTEPPPPQHTPVPVEAPPPQPPPVSMPTPPPPAAPVVASVLEEDDVVTLENVVLNNPHNLPALIQLAAAFVKQGDYDKALENIKRVIAEESDHVEANLVLGEVYFRRKEYPKAALSLEVVLNKDPKHVGALLKLAQVYIAQEKYSRALKVLNQAQKATGKPDAEVELQMAKVYYAQENLDQAAMHLMNARDIDPNNVEVYIALGHYYLDVKNPSEAKKAFESGLQLDPGNIKLQTYVNNLQ